MLKGCHIILASSSQSEGLSERRLLKDIALLSKLEATLALFCPKDSYIDKKTANFKGDKVLCLGGETTLYRLSQLRQIRQLLPKADALMVYQEKDLLPISFFVRQFPKVALVFNCCEWMERLSLSFWQKPLTSRVDQVYLAHPLLENQVTASLKVPRRKCFFTGPGFSGQAYFEQKERDMSSLESRFLIGTYISDELNEKEDIIHYVNAIEALNKKNMLGRPCCAVLLTEGNWQKKEIYSTLSRMIKDIGLEDHVLFKAKKDLTPLLHHFHVWVSLEKEGLDDLTMGALFQGVPILLQRHHLTGYFMHEHKDIGETYHPGDSRDLRNKLERLLWDNQRYQQSIEKQAEELKKLWSLDHYTKVLSEGLKKAVERRRRAAMRRQGFRRRLKIKPGQEK